MIAFATALIAIPAFTAQFVLFGPDAYLAAFERSSVYERLPALVATQLTHQLGYTPKDAPEGGPGEAAGGPPPALRALTTEQWTSILATVLPPDVARATIERAVRSVFAATASSDSPVTLSLTELRNRLASGAAVDAYFQVVRAQPPCTSAQVEELLANAATDLPACRPPEEVLAQLRPTVETLLGGLVAQIPDQQDLGESLSPETLAPLRTARSALLVSPLVPLLFLLLTAVLGARSPRAIARWWGVVLALAGGALASAALLLSPEFERRWDALVVPTIPPYWSQDVVATLHDLAASLVGSYATGLTYISAAVAIGGLALVLAPSLSRRASAPRTQPEAEPNS
ncbi:MAG: hypothetical protein ACRDF9_05755 [Candidatus Limnocylindria bacterium]